MRHRGLSTLFSLVAAILLGVPSAWAAAPAAPAFMRSFASSDASVTLLWDDNSTDETQFRIIYTDNNSAPDSFNVPSSSGTGIGVDGRTFFSLASNHPYTFAVCALNKNGEASSPTNTLGINIGNFNPPTSLLAVPLGEGYIVLTWADNAFFESGYKVDFRELPNGTWYEYGTSGPDGCSASLNHNSWMVPSKTYEFRVYGFQGDSASPTAYTDYCSATATLPTLTAPTGLTATPSATSPYQISFAWTDNSTMEHGYELEYRKQNLASPQPFAFRKFTNSNIASITNLPEFVPNTVYEFRVRAVFYNGTETIASDYYPASGGIQATTRNGFSCKPYAPITLGVPFSYQLATQSQSPRTGWTVGTLPAGLSFNNSTGLISGTVNNAGVYTVPLTANFANGTSHAQTLTLRVIAPPAPPQIVLPIGAQTLTQSGSASLWLASYFADPDTESALSMFTSKGKLDLILYANSTPQTVANFLSYAHRSSENFNGTLFHRAPAGFVLQGGGFYSWNSDTLAHITTLAPVANEPGISNTFGTLAMAKKADQPDSATSEFFFNLGDNSANLDAQDGGFTVFGRVAIPSITATLVPLASIPTISYTFPVYDYITQTTTATPFSDLPADSYGIPGIVSVEPLPVLTYSIIVPPNSAVATAALSGTSLQVNAVASGTTAVTVGATDVDGNTTSQTFAVTVQQTVAEWAAGQGLTGSQAAPGARQPNGLTNLHAFAFMADPAHGIPAHLPTVAVKASDPTPRAKITFPVRKYAAGLTYVVEASSTLGAGDWTPLWNSADGFGAPAVSAVADQGESALVTIADTQPATASARRFLRVKLIGP